MSPSKRSSTPSLFRCERSKRRYRGIGGNRAAGAGLKGLDAPASVAVANNLEKTLICNNGLKRKECGRESVMHLQSDDLSLGCLD